MALYLHFSAYFSIFRIILCMHTNAYKICTP